MESYRAWATGMNADDPPSSNTGLSIEYEVIGGGDRDFFMLVRRRIRLTLPFSFFSLV